MVDCLHFYKPIWQKFRIQNTNNRAPMLNNWFFCMGSSVSCCFLLAVPCQRRAHLVSSAQARGPRGTDGHGPQLSNTQGSHFHRPWAWVGPLLTQNVSSLSWILVNCSFCEMEQVYIQWNLCVFGVLNHFHWDGCAYLGQLKRPGILFIV